MLKARIFVNQDTDVEKEIETLENLAARHSLSDTMRKAFIGQARALISDFKQTAIEAARSKFSAEIVKTIKDPKCEVSFVLNQRPSSQPSGIMRLFKR